MMVQHNAERIGLPNLSRLSLPSNPGYQNLGMKGLVTLDIRLHRVGITGAFESLARAEGLPNGEDSKVTLKRNSRLAKLEGSI
jgi:hypothetical protein